ncbi:MAG: penicillin-binding protein 2 [Gammaproteobacteria bacterium]|nr:penicillin-binding protein 2 [Gammaproteobacteria bacterium]
MFEAQAAARPRPRPRRRAVVRVVVLASAALLIWRCVDLQVNQGEFLKQEGRARYLRDMTVSAHRGNIVDRRGEPLAVSTPVQSIWVNPQEVFATDQPSRTADWKRLCELLKLDLDQLNNRLKRLSRREFVYLKRQLDPALAEEVLSLALPGVYARREYRRYYPSGELTGHVVGFTNVADEGQEGLELAFDEWLRGEPGVERVLRDRRGEFVEPVASIRAPKPGRELRLSIDRRIQYIAYRALLTAVRHQRARAGSAIVLDPHTGQVLAMVNQPAFNPNNKADRIDERFRNRAVTDVFEPGSTIKPFAVAAALESGQYRFDTMIDTRPGYLKIGSYTVKDHRNYGQIELSTVIQKSSNVGAAKVAMSIDPEQLWGVYDLAGLGHAPGSEFPGEARGVMPNYRDWRDVNRITVSYGYGLSVTALQLARAYAAIANGGVLPSVSLVHGEKPVVGPRVMSARTARDIRRMLELVVEDEGTGRRARVAGYRVGGKTGTVHKVTAGGYSEDRYQSYFAGMAPMSYPRIVMIVVIDEPRGDAHFGGEIAAPVFAATVATALRVMGVAPDGSNGKRILATIDDSVIRAALADVAPVARSTRSLAARDRQADDRKAARQ